MTDIRLQTWACGLPEAFSAVCGFIERNGQDRSLPIALVGSGLDPTAPKGAFSLAVGAGSISRPTAAGSANSRRAREGTCLLAGKRAHKLFETA